MLTTYPHGLENWILWRILPRMSILVKIYDTETVAEIAKKIYYKFDVMASCTIYGFVKEENRDALLPKGEAVLMELRRLDDLENMQYSSNGKRQRKNKYKPNSIGGPIAQRIFTWDKKVVDSEPRYTIWRYQ